MSDLDRPAELARLLTEVRSLRLQPDDWDAIDDHLAAIEAGDDSRVDALSQQVFEARVRGRYSGPRTGGDVVPTKQTSVLPVVGLICGGLLGSLPRTSMGSVAVPWLVMVTGPFCTPGSTRISVPGLRAPTFTALRSQPNPASGEVMRVAMQPSPGFID